MNKEKIKNVLEFQIPPRVSRSVGIVIVCLLSCILFASNAEAIAIMNDKVSTFLIWTESEFWKLSVITIAILWLFLYCLTGKLLISYVIMEVGTTIWGLANRIILYTRDQFITVVDFRTLGEAAEVRIEWKVAFHPIIIVFVVVSVILGILLWSLLNKNRKERTANRNKKIIWCIRALGLLGAAGLFIGIHSKPQQILMDDLLPFRKTGNVVWFCQSVFSNVAEDLSYEEVCAIYNKIIESEKTEDVISTKRPNIVVVMSEAFWNINNLEGLVEASENPMDKYFEITKDAIRGEVAVNVYGGGTNQSEFEFLTGLNAKYLLNVDCYDEYFEGEQESLVSYLNELGYYSMAFHPYTGEFWQRETAYPNIGFSEFYDREEFMNTEKCHGYISDKAMTQEIIARFESRKELNPEQPIFAFAVSVQNHVNDMAKIDEASAKDGCYGITTKVLGDVADQESVDNVEEYYNGIKHSIDALEELLDYFSNYEEDTMVVFFGDHAPLYIKLICDTDSVDDDLNMYRTPYMIWTNYENDYESYGDFNLSYLSSVLFDYLDYPKTQQYYLNKYMMKNCVINTRFEKVGLPDFDRQKEVEMMNIVIYMCKNFPKQNFALPYWQIVE